MLVAGIVLVLVGVLVVVITELAASGRLGINSIAGLRFGAMLASDEGWTVGHRAARVPLDLAGVALVIAGLIYLVVPMTDGVSVLVVIGAMVFTLAMVAIAAVVGNRAATQVLLRMIAEGELS